MKNYEYQIPRWMILLAVVFAVIGVVMLMSAGLNSPEMAKIFDTPVKDMTIGHATCLVVLLGAMSR